MEIFFKRMIHNKIKLCVLIFTLLLPLIQTIQIIVDVYYWKVPKYDPNYVTFLAGYRSRLAYYIYLWIMPVYFLLVAGESSIQDQQIGYRLMMIEREGKRKYVKQEFFCAFFTSFLIMMFGLLLNYAFLQIILYGGKEIVFDTSGTTPPWFYKACLDHPALTNFIYAIEASVMAGLVGGFGCALSMAFRNRKIIYASSILLWTVMINMPQYNILRAIQPFELEYLSLVLKSFGIFALIYCLLIALCIGWVMFRDEV